MTSAETIACKNNETHFVDFFHVYAPLPPISMLKNVTPCLKIAVTTLYEGGGGQKSHVVGERGPINWMSQSFLHAIVATNMANSCEFRV